MFKIIQEKQKCIQGGGTFPVYILVVEGKRIFATEELEYLMLSPKTFEQDESTIILEWDSNSCELPYAGPQMDIEIYGLLYLHRIGKSVYVETEVASVRKSLFEVPLDKWVKAVTQFSKS